jgi:hypothetical protein
MVFFIHSILNFVNIDIVDQFFPVNDSVPPSDTCCMGPVPPLFLCCAILSGKKGRFFLNPPGSSPENDNGLFPTIFVVILSIFSIPLYQIPCPR